MEILPILLSLLWGSAAGLQCNVPGECKGQLIGIASQTSRSECLEMCKGKFCEDLAGTSDFKSNTIDFTETEGCTWYTFFTDGFFNIMETCTEIVAETCPICVSGEWDGEIMV